MQELTAMVNQRWPRPKLWRAAFMMGAGYSSEEIAADPDVRSHPSVVRRYARHMGHAFDNEPRGNLVLTLPRQSLEALRQEANKRKRTPEALGTVALRLLTEDTTLLANVLEDEI